MSDEESKLQHLVRVINAGQEFYEHVKSRMEEAEFLHFVDANIAARERALEKLQPQVVGREGLAEQGMDLGGRLEEYRAELQAALEANKTHVYMDHLEEIEDQTLAAFREALSVAKSPGLKSILEALEPDFEEMHNRMRSAQAVSAKPHKMSVVQAGRPPESGRSGRRHH